MSRTYGINDYIPNEVMAARLDELSHAVTEGPEAVRRECTMRIPAELDRDADVVLHECAKRLRELDTLRRDAERYHGLLLWVLYHHQGARSHTGQNIRQALGIGQYDRLTRKQIDAAVAAEIQPEPAVKQSLTTDNDGNPLPLRKGDD
tara:strand:- start:334 stop:777 length:444 start_codon:yes stop_codon:yes gene_type:complete